MNYFDNLLLIVMCIFTPNWMPIPYSEGYMAISSMIQNHLKVVRGFVMIQCRLKVIRGFVLTPHKSKAREGRDEKQSSRLQTRAKH